MKGGATLLVGAWQHGKQEVMHQSIPAMRPPSSLGTLDGHLSTSSHRAISHCHFLSMIRLSAGAINLRLITSKEAMNDIVDSQNERSLEK